MARYHNKDEFEKVNVFGFGDLNVSNYFSGVSYVRSLTNVDQGELRMIHVTFEPGCRNNWHVHKAESGGGQILVCTAGSGWYQEWGKEAVSLEAGQVFVIPANVKHWHGAKKDSWFSHIAFKPEGTGTSTEWLEAVDEEQYHQLEPEK